SSVPTSSTSPRPRTAETDTRGDAPPDDDLRGEHVNAPRPEASTPGLGRLEPHMSLPWVLANRLENDPAGVIFERKASLGTRFVPVTVQTFAEEVTAVAKGLIGLGVEPGDRVAIMAHTSYEWTLLDFASWSVGAVPVP